MTVDICNTDQMNVFVTVTTVGEQHPHAHNAEDATWFVIGGRAAFHEEGGSTFVADKNDFVCVPAGTKYWFESVGDEALEITRFACRDLTAVPPFDPDRPRGNPNVRAIGLAPIES